MKISYSEKCGLLCISKGVFSAEFNLDNIIGLNMVLRGLDYDNKHLEPTISIRKNVFDHIVIKVTFCNITNIGYFTVDEIKKIIDESLKYDIAESEI